MDRYPARIIMKNIRIFLIAAAAGIGTLAIAPAAMAHDQIGWSVNIGTGGYYAPPPPVVVYQPPVVYSPPPVMYTPPAVYPLVAPGVVYRSPGYIYNYGYGYRERPWRGRDHGWRHHHDRD